MDEEDEDEDEDENEGRVPEELGAEKTPMGAADTRPLLAESGPVGYRGEDEADEEDEEAVEEEEKGAEAEEEEEGWPDRILRRAVLAVAKGILGE